MDTNNKRIAKNTLYMYLRMAITMLVGLYTSRVVLRVLGVEDFGLYNVIGGIIAMFGMLNAAMTNTTSRYITVSLAKGDIQKTRGIFNMAALIHLCIAVIVLILGETVGLWYLYNKLVIPEGRLFAAEWLYQLSVISTLLSIITVPFNSTIVAHEKMSAFAFIQILDVFLKLAIVLMLEYSPFDRLIFYGTLLSCVTMMNLIIYIIYCKRKFAETEMMFYWNRGIFKEMTGFIGWSLVGNFSFLFYSQGLNLILNAFCGPVVNAARGISVQVENVVKQFANNVQVAINPQIMKSYAVKEMQRMYTLIFASSRFCFYLLFLIELPILIETDFLLSLWLGSYPDHTVNFMRIILMTTIMDAFVNPMYTANLASGKLMMYHLTLSIHMYAFMFVTYLSIKYTGIPESVFISLFVATVIGVVLRIIILYRQIGLRPIHYIQNVIRPIVMVVMVSIIAPLLIHNFMESGWIRFLATSIISVLSVALTAYTIGISSTERAYVVEFVKKKLNCKNRNI